LAIGFLPTGKNLLAPRSNKGNVDNAQGITLTRAESTGFTGKSRRSGVPVYRQLIDQVRGGIASGSLSAGDQLPTVRQVAVDLAINPNTVLRAYRELELGGLLETQQGTGTFITEKKPRQATVERERQLSQLVGEFLARAVSRSKNC
jgi:GntR family transcriptional regulator